jgi:hypothetical protein
MQGLPCTLVSANAASYLNTAESFPDVIVFQNLQNDICTGLQSSVKVGGFHDFTGVHHCCLCYSRLILLVLHVILLLDFFFVTNLLILGSSQYPCHISATQALASTDFYVLSAIGKPLPPLLLN